MRQPHGGEYIICPNSRNNTKRQPKSVFDTIDPNRNKVSYGIIDSHKHGFYSAECKWTDLAVRIVTTERYII